MATYKKELKTITIHTLLVDSPYSAADTAEDDKASRALHEFKTYGTITLQMNVGEAKIPYHAIKYIEVTSTSADVTKTDPYGCE